MSERKKWLYQGAIGCILIGFGFSLATEAGHWKHEKDTFWLWIGGGTVGIALLIMGIIILINNKK